MPDDARGDGRAVFAAEHLTKHFAIRRGVLRRTVGQVYAVDDVSFSIREGETLGLVGESGCGKSTVGKAALRLIEPTAGTVRLLGRDITALSPRELRDARRDMQIIYQDPYASLSPRLSAEAIVAEPLENYGIGNRKSRRERVRALLERVGLRGEHMNKLPHEFSGGQRQRIGIARALALDPKVIVADEPVSALDVSVQAQVLNLMADLQKEREIAFLFISHDLAVVEYVSHRVAVMYLGKVVEVTDRHRLFASPLHPYTEALLSAIPEPEPESAGRQRIVLEGDVPSPANPPRGCRFHTRCPYAEDLCRRDEPALTELAAGHHVACHLRAGGLAAPRDKRIAGVPPLPANALGKTGPIRAASSTGYS